MKKVFLFLLLAGVIAVSCNSNSANKTNTSERKSGVVYDGHNAQNALDYKGEYKGILPCADCEGIETTLTLKDKDYVLKTKYIGKGDQEFEQKGTYTWKNGSTIMLDGMTGGPSQYFVGENFVKQLDMQGNEITGTLADNYILRTK